MVLYPTVLFQNNDSSGLRAVGAEFPMEIFLIEKRQVKRTSVCAATKCSTPSGREVSLETGEIIPALEELTVLSTTC